MVNVCTDISGYNTVYDLVVGFVRRVLRGEYSSVCAVNLDNGTKALGLTQKNILYYCTVL
jgi:hypothetical protein